MKAAQVRLPRRLAARDRTRAIVLAAVVLGVVLRLAFAFGYWVNKPLTLDEREYLLLATTLARGEGFTYAEPAGRPAERHFERPPMFAVFVAGILRLTDDPLASAPRDDAGVPRGFPRSSTDVPASIKVAQSFIGAFVIVLIAALTARIAGGAGAAVAAMLAAVYPPLASSSGYVLAEPLYSALALTVVWLLGRGAGLPGTGQADGPGRRGPTMSMTLVAGALAGVAVLTKESMIFFLPLAFVWLLARRCPRAAIALALGAALVLTPWIARNYGVYGRFVLTAPHGGVTFWTGNNALARGEGDLAANPEMGRARVAFEQSRAGAAVQEIDDAYYRDAFRFITRNPAAWCILLAKKVFYTFVPIGPSYRLHSRLYYTATVCSYGILFPFAVLGLVRVVRDRRAGRLAALWLLALSAVVVCVVFFPQDRFRLTVLDPVVLVCAAAWWGTLGLVRRSFAAASDVQEPV